MGTVSKEELERVREFFTTNPEGAKKFLAEHPEILSAIRNGNLANGENVGKMSGNSYGGTQFSKALPWMKDNSERNGFSNYIALAIFAFVIQLLVTLICIFFYK